MNNIEKASAAIGVGIFIFTLGVGWNSLNNRIDQVDEKMARIEKSVGSTACNSILGRQIEAIEKGSAKAREALEELSEQYKCVAAVDASYVDYMEVSGNAALAVELNAVDVLLNEAN